MALTIEQMTITEMQETLGSMYNARGRQRKGEQDAGNATVPVTDDPKLTTINAAQRALDEVYAAYS